MTQVNGTAHAQPDTDPIPSMEYAMTLNQNEYASTYLGNKLDALTERLNRIEQDRRRAAQPLSADSEDRAAECENDEVLDRLSSTTSAELDQVRHALERLKAGHYGRCEDCGAPISEARLQALPEATRCLQCINPDTARQQPVHSNA
jgi:RNA polymerase-binding transcription factor DksA